jgi:Macrocin-O-methyltransferase (TylF)
MNVQAIQTTTGIEFGKGRSDCSREQLDLLLTFVSAIRHISGDIVEVGSWKCGASIAMAATCHEKYVFAFDLFGGLPYGEGKGFENFASADWDEIVQATKPFRNLHLMRGQHEITVPAFASFGKPISLIFLDSDHYLSHHVTLLSLCPLLSKGGLIVFHDWTFPEVQKAVTEICKPEEYQTLHGNLLNMGALRKL